MVATYQKIIDRFKKPEGRGQERRIWQYLRRRSCAAEGKMLVNKSRVKEVMKRNGVDVLVASMPET